MEYCSDHLHTVFESEEISEVMFCLEDQWTLKSAAVGSCNNVRKPGKLGPQDSSGGKFIILVSRMLMDRIVIYGTQLLSSLWTKLSTFSGLHMTTEPLCTVLMVLPCLPIFQTIHYFRSFPHIHWVWCSLQDVWATREQPFAECFKCWWADIVATLLVVGTSYFNVN